MEEDAKSPQLSPTNSQQTVSDDDEIDYSVKPEFYDPELDDKDELWVHKQRKGRNSDAVLSCPACFTTLCLECQRHEKNVTQYRAVFVLNCKIETNQVRHNTTKKRKRGKGRREFVEGEVDPADGETFNPVYCSACSTEVGVIDLDEVELKWDHNKWPFSQDSHGSVLQPTRVPQDKSSSVSLSCQKFYQQEDTTHK